MLSEGWAYPLKGFMREHEYLSVSYFKNIFRIVNGQLYVIYSEKVWVYSNFETQWTVISGDTSREPHWLMKMQYRQPRLL